MHHTRRALARYVDKRGFVIGDYTYGVPEIMHWGNARLFIGSYSSIGPGVKVFLGGNHRHDWVSTYPFRHSLPFPEASILEEIPESGKGDVRIGSDVWIGAHAIILSGIHVGDGAVIGAAAVVTRDVPAYGIVVGNPARQTGTRFSEVAVAALLETRWWKLPRTQIVPLLPLLNSPNVETFLTECRRLRANHPATTT